MGDSQSQQVYILSGQAPLDPCPLLLLHWVYDSPPKSVSTLHCNPSTSKPTLQTSLVHWVNDEQCLFNPSSLVLLCVQVTSI